MLGGELAPPPVAMRTTRGMLTCPPDMYRSVAALFTTWSRESRLKLIVITSTIGRIPPSAAPIPGSDERRLESRRVAHTLRAELVEQPEAHGERSSVAADVLAHEEHPVVRRKCLTHRGANGLAVRELHRAHAGGGV